MENPYEAPSSRLEVEPNEEPQLADRGTRLGAVLLDALMQMAILLPVEFACGYLRLAFDAGRTHHALPLATVLMWSFVGIAVYALIQGYPLVKDGQTWGKKICSIRIVSLSGEKPSIQQLLVRYAVYLLLGIIPVVGILASIVSTCLIFRDDRRCGHDLVAGTRVVTA